MGKINFLAKKMKILIDRNIPYIEHFFHDHLEKIEYFSDQNFDIEKVKEDSIVVVRSTYKTHGKNIPKSVKFICSASTGEDHIDKNALDKMNIPYAFSTGANAIAVREYVLSCIALMLQENKLNKNDPALIIGCGNIGEGIFKVLQYFGFDVSTYDPYKPCTNSNESIEGYSLISLHVPLTKSSESEHFTENLFCAAKFEMCKEGAIVVNTSRGGVVSEKDFLEFNRDKDCIHLISDVYENEPSINKDFFEKNLFGTPHIAGHSQYARYQMTKMAYENIADFLGVTIYEKNNTLKNKIISFDKNTFDRDIQEFGLPISLMLDTYNPKLDHFDCSDFKKIRDNYNNRIGYSQVSIQNCDCKSDLRALKMLGFKVEEN